MRNRERGIGNMAFIAVLVLFVIALALFIMKQDEIDSVKSTNATLRTDAAAARQKLVNAQDAYDALLAKTGLVSEELARKGEDWPTRDAVSNAVQEFLKTTAAALAKSGECVIATKHYTVPPGAPAQETKGEDVLVKLFVQAQADDLLTFKGLLESIPGSLALASKMATENNTKFGTEVDAYRQRVDELAKAAAAAKSGYASDVASKQAALENAQSEVSAARDSLQNLTSKLDQAESDNQESIRAAEKTVRLTEREKNAWKNRALTEKSRKDIDLAEDPKDGEILESSDAHGIAWINLGRKHKVTAGQKFTVWRAGKGNVRENIGVVRVLSVGDTSSECRVVSVGDTPITKGNNVSNPFYNPTRSLRVHISGDLRRYTTDLAKARLAASASSWWTNWMTRSRSSSWASPGRDRRSRRGSRRRRARRQDEP
ncbi:MAG: hypothetical protein HC813_02330 [Planctomycetes bacterium]|nr:hypothetical protein [Planctomycetota bacterium]